MIFRNKFLKQQSDLEKGTELQLNEFTTMLEEAGFKELLEEMIENQECYHDNYLACPGLIMLL